jgi:hypothetical protein
MASIVAEIYLIIERFLIGTETAAFQAVDAIVLNGNPYDN